ncbi:hypothetical protein KUTeg_000096 [Tegillarca granosa]|uniref:Uncharacterized protein n=1 Tax=Tegillarca granosa TaxID=220873 RepID=A0ABQ9FZE0_TEGGR|nr:hypothetical protein KUTeg_000096 [Tegillarca granosa]
MDVTWFIWDDATDRHHTDLTSDDQSVFENYRPLHNEGSINSSIADLSRGQDQSSQNRMRITSKHLQRWLASWIAFIFIWCVDYVIVWINKTASVTDIFQFVLPVLLLMIVTSAFAEANGEGQRMIRSDCRMCICPTKDRLTILFFLNQQPLQMKVFNTGITYNAILGVILAFSVAFVSRIILDEVFIAKLLELTVEDPSFLISSWGGKDLDTTLKICYRNSLQVRIVKTT